MKVKFPTEERESRITRRPDNKFTVFIKCSVQRI